MGGTTFDHYVDGVDVNDAFRRAREEAGHEHGHGGYSGTIAEKDSFTIISRTPLLEMEANALADQLMDANDPRVSDKWGAAGAIPVIKNTRTVAVKDFKYLHDNEFRDYNAVQPALLEAVKGKFKLKKGEVVKSVSVTSYQEPNRQRQNFYPGASKATSRTDCHAQVIISKAPSTRVAPIVIEIPGGLDYDQRRKEVQKQVDSMKLKAGEKVVDWKSGEDTPGTAKVTAVAPKGATATRFIVVAQKANGYSMPIKPHGTWEEGFETQAEARKWATDICNVEKNWTGFGPLASLGDEVTLEIESVTRRADGQPLVAITRQVGKRMVNVDVTVKLASAVVEPGTNPDGWLFFGWASC